MKKNEIKLADYNTLAYEFAIRNPRVIELLAMDINDDVVKKLLAYGIDGVSYMPHEGQETPINSIQELYLDYDHLKSLHHSPYSPYGEGQWENIDTGDIHDNFRGNKKLIHPLSKIIIPRKESDEDAIPRINALAKKAFPNKGRNGGKFRRLMNGEVFDHYDRLTFLGESVNSIDSSTNTTKTIKSDRELVLEWIHPDKYLQLIPQYKKLLD